MPKINKKKFNMDDCPIRKYLKILWWKWAILILFTIKDSPKRFSEFKKYIPDITEKMLIQTIRLLEENIFLHRKNYNTIPPKVEYSILDKWTKALGIVDIIKTFDN